MKAFSQIQLFIVGKQNEGHHLRPEAFIVKQLSGRDEKFKEC